MKALSYLVLFLAIVLLSCTKVDAPKDTPKCIKKKIKGLIKSGGCTSAIYKFNCEGITFYYFRDDLCPPPNAPTPGYYYDENCAKIFFGCKDFYTIEKELIWEKE